ncbi:hypothetical protein HOE04_03405 [archaeon]|jgi:hypothetical protein|nr:hypothetical protein [archaeon]
MVKIFENRDGVDKGNRRNNLVRIAKESFLECTVNEGVSPQYFSVSVESGMDKSVFFVFPEQNLMRVYGLLGFKSAVELAKKYEQNRESEFSVQKCYS